HRNVANSATKLLECAMNSMGRFEENRGNRQRAEFSQPTRAVLRPNRWESQEHEGLRRKPTDGEGGDNRAWARNCLDSHSGLDCRPDQMLTRIGNHRRACI